MKTIWKYTIDVIDLQEVRMPKGAVILSLQTQHGIPRIWAMVDPTQPLETRTIITYGTGHPIRPEELDFIGTYQIEGGREIFHAFERK